MEAVKNILVLVSDYSPFLIWVLGIPAEIWLISKVATWGKMEYEQQLRETRKAIVLLAITAALICYVRIADKVPALQTERFNANLETVRTITGPIKHEVMTVIGMIKATVSK